MMAPEGSFTCPRSAPVPALCGVDVGDVDVADAGAAGGVEGVCADALTHNSNMNGKKRRTQ
jgi:hypothetical protein